MNIVDVRPDVFDLTDEPYLRGCDVDGPQTLELPVVTISPRPARSARGSDAVARSLTGLVESSGRAVERVLWRVLVPLGVAVLLSAALASVPWTDMTGFVESLRGLAADAGDAGDARESPSAVAEGESPDYLDSLLSSPPTSKAPAPPAAAPRDDPSQPTVQSEVARLDVGSLDRVQPGMTIDEVTATVGVEGWAHSPGFAVALIRPSDPELQRQFGDPADDSTWDLRTWPAPHFGDVGLDVIFRDGRAVEVVRL